MNRLRLGTRGSQLALVQSRWVQSQLQHAHPGLTIELVIIKTSGDRFVDQPLAAIGGKGVFVKEIETALCAREIDCAVHSMKDVPAELADGLVIAAVPPREDPRDVLIARGGAAFADLPRGTRFGSSSPRRMALLQSLRTDVVVFNMRGNVDTRLRKLDSGDADALVLAAAGLRRLGIDRAEARPFDPAIFVPAIGQGALAIESRDDRAREFLAVLDDPQTRTAVTAERAFLQRVGGSCRTPLAAHAVLAGHRLEMRALIAQPDGRRVLRTQRSGTATAAAALGTAVADELLAAGGREILAALR